MATASSQLQLAFSVNLGGLETGMRQAASTVRSGAGQIRGALEDAGHGAERAGKGIGGLADKLREYRREEVMQGRSTRFFAAELASLLPVSNDVAKVLGKVAGVLSGGIGIGLAFEGVKFLLEYTRDAAVEMEKLRGEVDKTATSLAAAKAKADEFFAAMRGGPAAGAAVRYQAAVAELSPEIAKAQAEIDKKKAEIATGKALNEAPRDRDTRYAPEYDVAKKELELQSLLNKREELYQKLRLASGEYQKTLGDEAKKEGEALSRTEPPKDPNAWLRDDMRGQMPRSAPTPEMQPVYPATQLPTGGGNDPVNAYFVTNTQNAIDAAMAEKDRLLKEDERRTEEYARNIEHALAPMERGFSDVFTAAITGSMGTSEAIAKMGQNIVQSTVSMITQIAAKKLSAHIAEMMMDKQKVAGNAATAASGAAASQASIPIVGPVMAMAAMAAMQIAVMGLTKLFSAAGGFDVPAGLAPITQLHPREMVLPAEHADTIRRLGREGGGGGETYNVNVAVSAIDARSGAEFLRRQAADIVDAIDRERRARRAA